MDGEYRCTCIYFIAVSTHRLRSNDTPVPIITLDIQITLQQKEPEFPGEMTDFMDGTGNELEEPEISCGDRKQETAGKKSYRGAVNGDT